MTAAEVWAVELEHRVARTPDVVFQYFTVPHKFRLWQGVDAELDPRPGGIFKIATAPDTWARGEYVVVDPPHRIVFTWGFESDGIPLPRVLEQVPPGSSVVEVDLVADGTGTLIRLRHSELPTQSAQWAHELGWNLFLPRLRAVCGGEDPGENPIIELASALYSKDDEIAEQASPRVPVDLGTEKPYLPPAV